MDDKRERRLTENEVRFRAVNERVERERLGTGAGEEPIEFLCECTNEDCVEPLRMSLREYEQVRSDPRQFAVVPGHERGAIEEVVADEERFRVVRKTGEAAEVAETTDPR